MTTVFDVMQRLVGVVKERPGGQDDHLVQWAHEMAGLGHGQADEVPWCSSVLNAIAMLLGLPRSKSAAARSWLNVGQVIDLADAKPGQDVVVLKRGVHAWQGHVGLFAGRSGDTVHVLGANQGNAVSIAPFPVADVIGVRRLA